MISFHSLAQDASQFDSLSGKYVERDPRYSFGCFLTCICISLSIKFDGKRRKRNETAKKMFHAGSDRKNKVMRSSYMQECCSSRKSCQCLIRAKVAILLSINIGTDRAESSSKIAQSNGTQKEQKKGRGEKRNRRTQERGQTREQHLILPRTAGTSTKREIKRVSSEGKESFQPTFPMKAIKNVNCALRLHLTVMSCDMRPKSGKRERERVIESVFARSIKLPFVPPLSSQSGVFVSRSYD